jgi:alpha-beta hydrolase superfamily lysophospholipase
MTWRCAACAVVGALLVIGPRPRAAASRTVSLRTDDGVALAATWYEAARQPAAAVILLHMLSRSRDDWQSVGHRLADAGIHALAVDFRGHGSSGGGDGGDLARLTLDVGAARTFLAARPDAVRPNAIGIAGASLGANVAVLAAAGDAGIRSLALLSPSLDYRGLRTAAGMRTYGARAALLVAGTDDPYALRTVRELATLGGGPREVRTAAEGGHGTSMLVRDPDLPRALVDWFQRTLL